MQLLGKAKGDEKEAKADEKKVKDCFGREKNSLAAAEKKAKDDISGKDPMLAFTLTLNYNHNLYPKSQPNPNHYPNSNSNPNSNQ